MYIVAPKDGAKIKGPVTVVFGLKGMGVAPAGIKLENTGHHHLLIDSDPPADLAQPLAANEKSVHFGKGQTETTADAAAGQTHAATGARRFAARAARPGRDLEEDHHRGREIGHPEVTRGPRRRKTTP